ncbi:peptide ABC transporter permease [Tateyamaria omphalii]|uniref:ABC transporter permease n=1 Tax=Tateyamaria omphalii TaxID=299262 RepID=UPI001679DEBC|nr:ABC transporter permease [Tateyamaria omphalii]GGX68057.1 peptide ABC transporter permease [Tateyamaria omphalii]
MISSVFDLVLRALIVLAGTALATFALLWHAPGDPALSIALARFDTLVTDEVIEMVREEAGLNIGFWPAFRAWIGPLLWFDFGNSSVTGREVLPDLLVAVSYTFPLAFAGLAFGVAVALLLAFVATKRPGGWMDRVAVGVASLGAAIPAYWLGLLLILLFAVHLAWLPAMGARTPAHAILPALTLGLGVAASLTRIIRSSILEARAQPFLPAIRRRGVPSSAIGRDHVAPHAAVPVITLVGLEMAFLLEGAVMVEIIFGRPGLGTFLVTAIEARDFPQVQAVVVLTALLFVTINLVIDVIYRVIDPRIGGQDA